ncbi:MAG: hypothetical protein ACYC46_06305 [Acidobacteriaceae bacterium]
MTTVEVLYRYDLHPTEATMISVGALREVYGIRKIKFNEAEKTVRVEYDATRLNEPAIYQLLRRTGLDLVEALSLIPPQPAPEVPAVTPAS